MRPRRLSILNAAVGAAAILILAAHALPALSQVRPLVTVYSSPT